MKELQSLLLKNLNKGISSKVDKRTQFLVVLNGFGSIISEVKPLFEVEDDTFKTIYSIEELEISYPNLLTKMLDLLEESTKLVLYSGATLEDLMEVWKEARVEMFTEDSNDIETTDNLLMCILNGLQHLTNAVGLAQLGITDSCIKGVVAFFKGSEYIIQVPYIHYFRKLEERLKNETI